MDPNRLTSALARLHFESTRVRAYGDGFLVRTPLQYSDGDTVTIGVFPLGGAYKVTDRAEALDRLGEAGLVISRSNRTRELMEMLRREAHLAPIDAHELELADLVVGDQLADGVMKIATLAQKIEHLRWTLREAAPQQYRDVVIAEASSIASRHKWIARPNASVELNTGQARRFTATVDVGHRRGFVQALSITERHTAVEHAYFLFSHLEAERDAKLAVFDMRGTQWPESELRSIEPQGTVVRYEHPRDLEDALLALEVPALS